MPAVIFHKHRYFGDHFLNFTIPTSRFVHRATKQDLQNTLQTAVVLRPPKTRSLLSALEQSTLFSRAKWHSVCVCVGLWCAFCETAAHFENRCCKLFCRKNPLIAQESEPSRVCLRVLKKYQGLRSAAFTQRLLRFPWYPRQLQWPIVLTRSLPGEGKKKEVKGKEIQETPRKWRLCEPSGEGGCVLKREKAFVASDLLLEELRDCVKERCISNRRAYCCRCRRNTCFRGGSNNTRSARLQ